MILTYLLLIISVSTQEQEYWPNMCDTHFISPERQHYLESKFKKNIDGGIRRPNAWKGDIRKQIKNLLAEVPIDQPWRYT